MARRLKEDDQWEAEYMALIHEFPLKPIDSEKELRRATRIGNKLVDHGLDTLTGAADAYFAVLCSLIKAYEDVHYPIPDATDAEMLAHLIEARGITQRDVAKGTRMLESSISNLLAGRRKFTRDHIERLSKYFKVKPALFLPG